MKALVFDRSKNEWDKSIGFEMIDLPEPALDESKNLEDATSVIIKLKYAGVCGSDRNFWYRTAFKSEVYNSLDKEKRDVRIVGHEFLGEVIAKGSRVDELREKENPNPNFKVEVGDLISGDSHVTCGKCYQCQRGEQNVCTNELILGITTNGIFAEYAKIPAKNLWPVDIKKIRPEIAAAYDPFGNAVHATTKVDLKDKTVAILGCGAIGLFSIVLAKNFGAKKIIAVDVNENNLKMAKASGADEVIKIISSSQDAQDSNKEVVKKVLELTDGIGADVAMEMAGHNSSVSNAIESVRRGGHIILFGLKDGDFIIPKFSSLIIRGITLHGVIGREIFKTWQIAQKVLENKKSQDVIWDVILRKGEGSIFPFQEFNKESFEKAMRDNPKIIFKF